MKNIFVCHVFTQDSFLGLKTERDAVSRRNVYDSRRDASAKANAREQVICPTPTTSFWESDREQIVAIETAC